MHTPSDLVALARSLVCVSCFGAAVAPWGARGGGGARDVVDGEAFLGYCRRAAAPAALAGLEAVEPMLERRIPEIIVVSIIQLKLLDAI